MYRLKLISGKMGPQDNDKDSQSAFGISKKGSLLSEPLTTKAAAIPFAIECGACQCIPCHETRRMKWRRGDEWRECCTSRRGDSLATSAFETKKRERLSPRALFRQGLPLVFRHPRAFRIWRISTTISSANAGATTNRSMWGWKKTKSRKIWQHESNQE